MPLAPKKSQEAASLQTGGLIIEYIDTGAIRDLTGQHKIVMSNYLNTKVIRHT